MANVLKKSHPASVINLIHPKSNLARALLSDKAVAKPGGPRVEVLQVLNVGAQILVEYVEDSNVVRAAQLRGARQLLLTAPVDIDAFPEWTKSRDHWLAEQS